MTLSPTFLNRLLLGACFFIFTGAAWQQTIKSIDMDGDGIKETDVYYEKAKRICAYADRNQDGVSDAVIRYKNDLKVSAETDSNYDTLMDTFIQYDSKGNVRFLRSDLDNDGRAQYWKYVKQGYVYKQEWDRNQDSKVDLRIFVSAPSQYKGSLKSREAIVLKQADLNYDGRFELVSVQKQAYDAEKIVDGISDPQFKPSQNQPSQSEESI